MEIKPGIGLGNFNFGMNMDDVKSILGEPIDIENDNILKVSTYYYSYNIFSFDFNMEDNYKLESIILGKGSTNVKYKGKNLFEMEYDEILNFLRKDCKYINYEKEDNSIPEIHEIYNFNSLGIDLTFDKNKNLSMINLHEIYEYDEEEES